MPTILATSIGFQKLPRGPLDWRAGPIFGLATRLARPTATPRVCFLATAVGDASDYIRAAYAALSVLDVRVSHLNLFPMPNHEDIRGHLLGQDLIWVGGGSVVNLLAVWRAHGLDSILHECWQAGVVLGGVSAGSLCWHVGGTTDSFGPRLQPVTNGLGWLPFANGVHFDSEPQRRPLLHRLIGQGQLPSAYSTDDGVGLIYRGTEMIEAVTETDGKAAYYAERTADGEVRETRIVPRLLR
jgi:peptidase E